MKHEHSLTSGVPNHLICSLYLYEDYEDWYSSGLWSVSGLSTGTYLELSIAIMELYLGEPKQAASLRQQLLDTYIRM